MPGEGECVLFAMSVMRSSQAQLYYSGVIINLLVSLWEG